MSHKNIQHLAISVLIFTLQIVHAVYTHDADYSITDKNQAYLNNHLPAIEQQEILENTKNNYNDKKVNNSLKNKDINTKNTTTNQKNQITIENKITKQKKQLKNSVMYKKIIQPGDILRIDLPGEEGFNKDFLINRDGVISLPEIGVIKLSGYTIIEAEKKVYDLLSEIFLGLDKLSIRLKEQKLLVTVLGFVKQPGEVELPITGNIQMAINKAGGLLDGAQLNKFQLQRNGTSTEFNFKRYLDTGKSSELPNLKPLDTIFIPSSPDMGNIQGDFGQNGAGIDPTEDPSSIKVFGEVAKPGSFSYIKNITIIDALLKAGGVTRYASYEQIRILSDKTSVLFNLKEFLDSKSSKSAPKLPEGATIFVPKQVEQIKSGSLIVSVMGQVQKPGAYEVGSEVDFISVLANAGGPNRYSDTSMIRIIKSNGTVERFNLNAYTEGDTLNSTVPKINGGDAIFVPKKNQLIDDSWLKLSTKQVIQLIGAVNKPGRYQWAKGINFMDVLSHAGGPTEKADIANIKIMNTGKNGEAIARIFNMQRFLSRGGSWSELPKLEGGVTIIFPELPDDPTDNKSAWIRLSSDQAIYIMGAVISPGRYAFTEDLNILDILAAAEGPKEDADLRSVKIIHRSGPSPKVTRLNLINYFEIGDESLLPDVSPGDSIFIPSRDRSWIQKNNDETIRIFGAVINPGRFDFTPDMNLLDLLAATGGPTKTAQIEKITIINSSELQTKTHYFNLVEFMKKPEEVRLPIIRPGDTIFVPDLANSKWSYVMGLFKDIVSAVSLFALTKTLFTPAQK